MKKYLLLNFTGLFVFFIFACILISCGKSGKSEPESEASPKPPEPPTAPIGPKATKFTPQMIVEALEHVAEKMPAEKRAAFMAVSPLGDLYVFTFKINKELAEGKLKVSEISGKALGEAMHREMISGGALSRARAKANRIKCVNNLHSIGKALLGFSQDNGGRMPWNLLPSQQALHFGSNYNLTVGSIFGLSAMKSEIQTAKILISPCDKGRVNANKLVQTAWRDTNTKGGDPVSHDGLSYGLCLGGDFGRPATVIAMTRNLGSDDLAKSNWVGSDEGDSPGVKKRAMSGLTKSQGQIARADGSVFQSTDADLGATGKVIKAHINARGGTSPLGPSRTTVMLPY